MLLNHIKSKDLFSNYSDEKGESGFSSQNSLLQNSENDNYSQDFLSEQYPSQSMRMYQKYMCEPPLYKASSQIELSNKTIPVCNPLEHNRMKPKNQDDRPLINTIVNIMKESSNETKETLEEMLENINKFLSKNETLNQSNLEQFNQELKEFQQTMLQTVEQNKEKSEDLLKKDYEIEKLNQELSCLKHYYASSEKLFCNKISEEFSGHQGWLKDNLQKLIAILKQESSNKSSFVHEVEVMKGQSKEFSQLKTFLMKNFKDLEKKILSSTDDVLHHSANTLLNFSKSVSLRFEQILKNCSKNFEDSIQKQFESNEHYQEENIENLISQNIKNSYQDLQEKINSMCEIQHVSFQKISNELYHIKQKMDILSQNMTSENQKFISVVPCERDFNIKPYNAVNKKHIDNDNRFFDIQNNNVNSNNSLNVIPYNPGQLRRSQRIMSNNYNTQAQTSNLSQVVDLKNSQLETTKKLQECSQPNLKNFQTFQTSNTSYLNPVWKFGKQSKVINRMPNQENENEYFNTPEYNFKNRISKKRRFNYLINEENDTCFDQLPELESQGSSPAISFMELNIPNTTNNDEMEYNSSIFHFNPNYSLKNFEKNSIGTEGLATSKVASHELSSGKGVRKRNKKNR
eukprot:XP_014775577.1 PREDICTED: putative uncharacterized protein DDB_G0282133 [Octopus bimaculoides]